MEQQRRVVFLWLILAVTAARDEVGFEGSFSRGVKLCTAVIEKDIALTRARAEQERRHVHAVNYAVVRDFGSGQFQ